MFNTGLKIKTNKQNKQDKKRDEDYTKHKFDTKLSYEF